MEWSVWPWGRWEFRGRCTDNPKEKRCFEAEVTAVTDTDIPGVLLRAPTKEEGMVRMYGIASLQRFMNYRHLPPLLCSNTSVGIPALEKLSSHSGN